MSNTQPRTARDLWKVCNDYGVVVDSFIPYKKSKAGKRFTFVRFIKVDNIDRLVANLCTIWIGRFHLYTNVARFHRERKPSAPSHTSNANERNSPGSYVSILKSGKTNNIMFDQVLPSLILDDPCILDRDFSLSLMGSVYWVHAKEMESWDPFICNDSYESESFDDEEDAKDDGSQSGDKVILPPSHIKCPQWNL
ncbi:RNA-directed DNA polymerase, eukaryota, nucleotide-binding alpha-beta plait domain protein [Tanacetum coccineum]